MPISFGVILQINWPQATVVPVGRNDPVIDVRPLPITGNIVQPIDAASTSDRWQNSRAPVPAWATRELTYNQRGTANHSMLPTGLYLDAFA
jgi:hypothetical protein